MNDRRLERALGRLGELLSAQGGKYAITIIGGAALALLGWVKRTTEDVDILTFADRDDDDRLFETPDPLPEQLRAAVATVARDEGLSSTWLNRGPAAQWRAGLPPGFVERLQWRDFGSLRVGLPGRRDLIALKLFAEVDRGGGTGQSVDINDLAHIRPTDEELAWAAEWVKTQDAGEGFPEQVDKAVHRVKQRR